MFIFSYIYSHYRIVLRFVKTRNYQYNEKKYYFCIVKQEKTYGDSHAPNRSVPLCCPFFSTFFQKTPQDESLKMPMFYTCSADFIPFTFTGKEKDSESGFYYFGARYDDCDLSGLFLSVDPMSDKYPSLSPYNYCAWNPVKLVDPDGMRFDSISMEYVDWFKDKTNDLISNSPHNIKEYQKALDELRELEQSSQVYHISKNNVSLMYNGETSYDLNNNYVNISFDGNVENLAHEFVHAYQFEKGDLSFSETDGSSGILYDISDERSAFKRQSYYNSNFKVPSDEYIISRHPVLKGKNNPLSIYSVDNYHNGTGTFSQSLSQDKTFFPKQIYRIDGQTFCGRKKL